MDLDIARWLSAVDIENTNPRIRAVLSVSGQEGWNVRESVSKHVEIIQVLNGSYSCHADGLHYIVSAGEVLVIPPGSLRSVSGRPGEDAACHVVLVRFPEGERHTGIPRQPLICRTGSDETLLRLFSDLSLEWAVQAPGYTTKCRALLLLILHRYLVLLVHHQPHETQDPRVEQAIGHIVLHLAEPLRVSDLSELSGLNPVYFGTLFKSCTGMSVKAFINRVRVNRAESLIAAAGLTVEEAARRCGFDDVSYFSKVFKKERGHSPSRTDADDGGTHA